MGMNFSGDNMAMYQDAQQRAAAAQAQRDRATSYQDRDYIMQQIQQGLGSAGSRPAPQAGYTNAGAAQLGHAAQINGVPQDQFRGMQMDQAQQLARIAGGLQKGAGELAAQRGVARGVASQQAMAHLGRGGNAATMGLGAVRGAADTAQAGVGQMQQSALSDQQAAQAQLTNALGQGRGQDIGLATSQAGMNQQMGLANMDATNQRAALQAQLNQGVSLANIQAQLQQTGMNDAQIQSYLQQLTGMNANEMNAALQLQINQQNQPSFLGNMLSMGGQLGAAAIMHSDERLKTDVTDSGSEVDAMLDALRPKSYRYKDERHGKGRRPGIMAQDLESSKLGKDAVYEAPAGKALDINKALSLALASVARLNQRVRKVEGK